MSIEQPQVVATQEKEKKKELLEELAFIVRTVSGKYDLKVTTEVSLADQARMAGQGKDAHKTWYRMSEHDPLTRKKVGEYVHIPKEFEMNDNAARGIAAHEAGHVRITRFGEFIPEKVMQEIGFHSLIASVEERPTDQVVREVFPGAGIWVDEARKYSVEDGRQGLEQSIELGEHKEMPRFQQLGNLIVYEPHYAKNGISTDTYSQEVLDAYEKIRNSVERIEKAIPPDNSSEETVLKFAKERYKILYKEVWPLMQELVKKDIEDEEVKRMTDSDSMEDLENLRKLMENLPADLQREFQEVIQKKIIEEISKQLREAILKYFNSLPKEERNKILEQIKEGLEGKEDILVDQLTGKFGDPVENHAASKKKKKEEEKRKAEEEKNKAEIDNIDKKLERIQADLDVYEQFYKQVHELDEQLFARLEEIFVPNIKHRVLMKSSGTRINISKIYKWESARKAGVKSLDNKIFESIHRPEKADYAITLLVDLSGSMAGKIEETFKAMVLLAEVLNRLGVKIEILGFQDEIIQFKSFEEELNDDIRIKMSGMLKEVSDKNPGGHNNAMHNNDGPCLANASERLSSQSNRESFLLVFSDGMPTGPGSIFEKKKPEDYLNEAIKNILTLTNHKLIGLGLGKGTEHVKRFYPTSLPNIDVKQLADVLGELIEDLIVNPEKYALSLDK